MAWNRTDADGDKRQSPSLRGVRPLRSVFVVGGTMVVALVVWLFVRSSDSPTGAVQDRKGSSQIKDAAPAVPPPASRPAAEQTATNATVAAETNAVEMFRGQRVVKKTVVTNGSYLITRIYTADGNFHRIEDWAMPPDGLPSSTDQLLAMAIGGDDMPPVPVAPGADAEFRKSLEKPIIVLESDSEEIKAWKRSMNEARLNMKEQLDAGKTFAEVIAEHQEMTRHNTEMRAKAQEELVKIVDGGDMESAKQYLETMNAALDSMGIKPIKMPMTHEEKAAALQQIIERRSKAK